MDKTLFSTRTGRAPAADTTNHAGGKAYALGAQQALAQLSVTGCFGDTYYASASDQVAEAKKVLAENSPEFIAKCAIYARERANMKDMPAFMLAYLTAVFQPKGYDENGARRAFKAAFPHVIDNGNQLRKFVQVVRSGAVGRKSFGTAVKRTMQSWLNAQSDWRLFKDQVGEQPSLADVIKMVRPNPGKGTPREALYRYLIGKKLEEQHNLVLPQNALEYIAWKAAHVQGKAEGLAVPAVDFRLLDSLSLSEAQWKEVFRAAPWSMTRQNLNTAERHGVLKDKEMVELIAARLRNPELVRKSRDFPFALLATFLATRDSSVPHEITEAIQDAMEIATEKVPALPGEGQIVVCPDVSGSMQWAHVTGARSKPTIIRCIDAAALIAATLVRKNPGAILLPFSDRLNTEYRVNPRDSIMTISQQIASLPSGGTNVALPLLYLNGQNSKNHAATNVKAIFIISDNESWIDNRRNVYGTLWHKGTGAAEAWEVLRRRNPQAKLFCINLAPSVTAQVPNAQNALNIGGFSDDTWRIFELFMEKGSGASWIDEINSIDLDAPSREA